MDSVEDDANSETKDFKSGIFESYKSYVPAEVQNLCALLLVRFLGWCPLWLKYILCHMKVPSPQRLIH